MASTTYEHFVDVNKMYAIHGRFLDLTKTYHLGNVNKAAPGLGLCQQAD